MITQDWTITIWRHFGIELPAAWEMLLFSRKLDAGRCAFADRYQMRLEMNWRRVPGVPDRERMLSDYMARLKEDGVENLKLVDVGGWDGLIGDQDERPVSRFGRYFRTEGCLLELVFLWPRERDRDLENHVLGSVKEKPAPDGNQRWRAFGLDVTVPERLELQACRQHAARTEFEFAAPRGVDAYRFMRLGMVSEWLSQSPGDWLPTQIPAGIQVDKQTVTTVNGHRMATLAGRAKHWYRGLRLHRPLYEAWAGICPRDGRLYFVSRQGSIPGQGVWLACGCGGATAAGSGERGGGTAIDSAHPQLMPPGRAESWAPMLRAKPLRNHAARVEKRANGGVALFVSRAPEKLLKPPLSWIVPVRAERRVFLDGIGRNVWDLCDDVSTVEDIVDAIAVRYDLTFHESRVSVTGYLKSLIQRGILAIQVKD